MSWSRWPGRVLLATVVPLLVVEGGLQVGAAWVAWKAPAEPEAAASSCAVLCVGDSFTYGLGATAPEHAWPAALERLLREAPIDGASRVVNGGWPGRNSRNVLEELPRQIRECRPRYVCVLVGINDIWSRPERFQVAELPPVEAMQESAARRYRCELRLPRLIALLLRSPEADAPPVEAHPLLAAPMEVAPPDDPPEPEDATGRGDGSGRRAREGARDGAHQRPRDRSPLARATREAMRRREFEKALECARRWIAAEPDDPRAHKARVEPAAVLGRREIVDEEIAWLERRRAEHPEAEVSESLVAALQDANRWPELKEVAKADLELYPGSEPLWRALAMSAEREHDDATAERAIARSLELGSRDAPALRAWKLCIRAGVHGRRGDVRASQRDMLESFLLSGDASRLRQMAPQNLRGKEFDPALLEQLGAELGATAEQLARAKAIFVEALDPKDDATRATLEEHLRQLVRYCRSHGAEPIVLTYPFPNDHLERIERAVTLELGVPLVDLRRRFNDLFTTHSSVDLIFPDGHCTDLGYAFVAESVAAALAARAPSPK